MSVAMQTTARPVKTPTLKPRSPPQSSHGSDERYEYLVLSDILLELIERDITGKPAKQPFWGGGAYCEPAPHGVW